jgi:hypothetical protein
MLNLTPTRVLRAGIFCVLSAFAVMPAGAASRTVAAGGDLQGALNQAQGGDTITIAAGAQFTGHFTLAPNQSGKWITIQSSAMSSLPGTGQRVTPAQAKYMPKLITPDNIPLFIIPSGANYYRIQGIEFTVVSGVYANDLIQSGTGQEVVASQLPQNIDFDRDYIHGDPVSGGKRGIALNSATTTIENCYFAAFTSNWQDTQAIEGWNGSGPFTIQNNHLEAGTEIVAFGGATPAISGLIPSNITIQNNEFYKPTSYFTGSSDYAGVRVWAKNHIELKNAQNVTIQNNTFTNNFLQADQLGFTLVFNVRDEDGTAPWATVSNVTVTNNTFQHVAAGVLFMGHDGDGGGTAGNFKLQNNLWTDMGVFGGDGRMYEVLNGVAGIIVDHDTAFPNAFVLVFAEGASSGVRVTNSIYTTGWGVAGDGSNGAEGAMVGYDNDGSFSNSAVIGGNAGNYRGAHFGNLSFPANTGQVGFVSMAAGNYNLSSTSPYHAMATDGKDMGASFNNGSTAPTGPSIPTGWVNIVSKNSGKCMDVTGVSTAPGALLHQWSCWGGDNQKFQFTAVPGGYKITVKNSGLQLDIQGGPGATQNGALLTQYPYWGGTNEIFQVTQGTDGYWTLQVVSSGKVLDVDGVSTADGALIHQWDSWGGNNQKWSFVPVQ